MKRENRSVCFTISVFFVLLFSTSLYAAPADYDFYIGKVLIFVAFNTGLIYSKIVGQQGIRFDLTKYSWVGKANSELRVFVVGLKTPYNSIKEIMEAKDPPKVPASGVGSQDYRSEEPT